MNKDLIRDDLFIVEWKNGRELVCIKVKVTRRERVVLADTNEEYDLITAIDSIGRRYTNLKPGLYINKANVICTYRIDKWEYLRTKETFYTHEELKKKLTQMEHELNDVLHGVFQTKYFIDKFKSLYCN